MIQVTSPAPRAVWQTLVQHDPEALPSQTPEWLDCLCLIRGHRDASRLCDFADGQQLLLPLVRCRGLPTLLSIQASMPHAWGMGGLLVKHAPTKEHFAAIFADLAQTPSVSLSMLPNPRQGALWRATAPEHVMRIPRRAHVLDLARGFDTVYAERFTKTTRRTIRKAERLGVTVECDATSRLAPVFYKLHRRSVDRWAKQQNEPRWLAHLRAEQRDPLSKITRIADQMGSRSRIWVAWHEGKPVDRVIGFKDV